MKPLAGRRVAILVDDGFEQIELVEPRQALDDAGATTAIVSPNDGKVRAWDHVDWGRRFAVDDRLEDADAEQYDALLLPGGVLNPDALRANDRAVRFVRAFINAGKPIAAICHGPQTLIDADGVRGRSLTSYPSIRRDLINAGAEWTDHEVVIDRLLVTSRMPSDIPAFSRAMIEVFGSVRRAAAQGGAAG